MLPIKILFLTYLYSLLQATNSLEMLRLMKQVSSLKQDSRILQTRDFNGNNADSLNKNVLYYAYVSITNENTANPFGLFLYTSNTFFNLQCPLFDTIHDCSSDNSCNIGSTTRTIHYPFFNITGNITSTDVSIGSNFYASLTNIISVTSCTFSTHKNQTSINGGLGLGYAGMTEYDYFKPSTFSIYLWDAPYDGIDGALIFGYDSEAAACDCAISVTEVSTDWSFQIDSISTKTTILKNQPVTAILDLNYEFIGVPVQILTEILHQLSLVGIDCAKDSDGFHCSGLISESNMPNITLRVQGNNLTIFSSAYMRLENNQNRLKFMGLEWNNETIYQYVNKEFQDTVILGNPFFNYYYTVFDAEKADLKFQPKNTQYDPNDKKIGYLIPTLQTVGIVILALIILGCCYRYIRRRRQWAYYKTVQGVDHYKQYVPPVHIDSS